MAAAENRGFRVAVVGATGAVGRALISLLEQRSFPVSELVPFASARSLGKPVSFRGERIPCGVLEPRCFAGVDFAFFDASDAVSKEWVPQAARAGAWVIDNSAAFRLDDDIPLVVPELGGALLDAAVARAASGTERAHIFSGPNCSTVQLVMALKPLHDRFELKRVIAATYQSVSGAGAAAMAELEQQARTFLDGGRMQPKNFPHQIAFNCIPQIGGFQADGFTSEETKIRLEARKILGLSDLKISATAVRVPTLSCHGEAVSVELDKPCDPQEARRVLSAQPGLVVVDDPAQGLYPMGQASAGADPVFVGRIRRDPAFDSGLAFWVVSDNLRKGAALNAIQIAEALLERLDGNKRHG